MSFDEVKNASARAAYEKAYKVLRMTENASEYLTQDVWESYFGGVSRETLADDFDVLYDAIINNASDNAFYETITDDKKELISAAREKLAVSANDKEKSKAMFVLVNAIPADYELNGVTANALVKSAREKFVRLGITDADAFTTLSDSAWRKQYGGSEATYAAVTPALELKTLLDSINEHPDDETSIGKLLDSLKFTETAKYLDSYVYQLGYDVNAEANDFAQQRELIERAFVKEYNAAAATRYDVVEIDLGLGVEIGKTYVGAEIDPDNYRTLFRTKISKSSSITTKCNCISDSADSSRSVSAKATRT